MSNRETIRTVISDSQSLWVIKRESSSNGRPFEWDTVDGVTWDQMSKFLVKIGVTDTAFVEKYIARGWEFTSASILVEWNTSGLADTISVTLSASDGAQPDADDAYETASCKDRQWLIHDDAVDGPGKLYFFEYDFEYEMCCA